MVSNFDLNCISNFLLYLSMSFTMKVPKIEKNSNFKFLGHAREKEKVSRNISGRQITEINRKTGEITYAVEFIETKVEK